MSTALNDRLFTTHSVFRSRRRVAAQDKVSKRTLRELQHFNYDGSYRDIDLAKGSHRSVYKSSWVFSFSRQSFKSTLFRRRYLSRAIAYFRSLPSHSLDPFTTSAERHFHAHNTAPDAVARSVAQDHAHAHCRVSFLEETAPPLNMQRNYPKARPPMLVPFKSSFPVSTGSPPLRASSVLRILRPTWANGATCTARRIRMSDMPPKRSD